MQAESNKRIRSNSYEDYINLLITENDLRYSTKRSFAQQSVKNLYEEFHKELKHGEPLGINYSFCQNYQTNDPLLTELLKREQPNQQKIISTIIFIITKDSKGFEVSGFIDFEESLRLYKCGIIKHNWEQIFQEYAKLVPRRFDLSCIYWKSGDVYYNDSSNYKLVYMDLCLYFQFEGDRKLIPAIYKKNNKNSSATTVQSDIFGFAILHDHIIRRKS